jgi:hypothetical protein
MNLFSRAQPAPALLDGGFLHQICTILANLKVVLRAKNISGGFPISGGFLADLTNSAPAFFIWRIWRNSGGLRISISKKQLYSNCFEQLVFFKPFFLLFFF